MRRNIFRAAEITAALAIGASGFATVARPQKADSLPSWNDSAPKRAILQFVKDVTAKGGAKYVSPAERIAVFDNDGTLWAEQPSYFQIQFGLEHDSTALRTAAALVRPELEAGRFRIG